ncbi:MAG TPA: phosphatase PAP2 family protein [Patescibacteria group bacterium]|nr:phosphatase PAP2 family protein [Patescibacteria group bacterium]
MLRERGRRSSRFPLACLASASIILSSLLGSPARAAETAATTPPAGAAPDDASATDGERPYWRTNLFGRFFTGQKYLFTTWWPSEFRRPAFTVPLLAGTALAISSSRDEAEGPDVQLERRFSEWTDDRNTTSAHVATSLGDGATGALLLGATYLAGRWSSNEKLSEASSLSAEALLDVGLYSTVLKGISARTRPSAGGTGDFFEYRPDGGESPDSFPSGHAMGAFAVATVFSGVYRDHRWVPWLAYGAAGLVGASRVALGRHFPSDVFVGAILGNSLGRMVLTRQGESEGPVSRLTPLAGPAGGAGLVWTRTW